MRRREKKRRREEIDVEDSTSSPSILTLNPHISLKRSHFLLTHTFLYSLFAFAII